MRVTSPWAACVLAALTPIIAALVIVYSDVQSLKATKADTCEVLELKVEFTKQMTRNTVAIENLNSTLKAIRETLYEQ